MRIPLFCCLAVAFFAAVAPLQANPPAVFVPHPVPDNIFSTGTNVTFNPRLSEFYAGSGTATVTVVNYFGTVISSGSQPISRTGTGTGYIFLTPLNFGASLAPGYYKISIAVNYTRTAGGTDTPTLDSYFGVSPFSTRTAAQVLSGGYRFGLKTFSVTGQNGPDPIWNLADAVSASASLGLQWTRQVFNQTNTNNDVGTISTSQLVSNYPINVVSKVEGFPTDCFDTTRYGALSTWQSNNAGRNYYLSTVPITSSYQTWLAGQLGTLPTNQPVYELGNEPWNQIISPADFAAYCQIVLPTLNANRSGAIVGPNLGSSPAWDGPFIAAGGLAGMSMVTLHPYSFTPLPETRTRVEIRNYHDFLKSHLGHDLDLYTTEYGWSTAPSSTTTGVVSETIQAERTVRQDLMLYAEGLKTLIPHWMGDVEHDPTDWDQWFGFFHRKGEPRPVVLAHAACARMIDGSVFVGDLNLGPGIGAMLFNQAGVYTLALWTAETNIPVTVNTGVGSVGVVDIMGNSVTTATNSGNLTLNLSGNVQYLTGVSASLASTAVPPTADLNPDTWSARVGSFNMQKTAAPPTIDGNLADWSGVPALPLTKGSTTFGNAYLCWDNNYIYVAAQMTDAQIVASSSSTSLLAGDAFQVQIGTRPSRQLDLAVWGIYDYSISIAPTSAGGTPAFRMECANWNAPIVNPAANDPSGIQWACVPSSGGWTAEARIPISLLNGFPGAVAGSKVSCYLQGYDKDSAGGSVTTYSYLNASATRLWPYLTLQDPTAGSQVIVDNADATGVNIVGAWSTSTNQGGYYGTNYLTDDATGKGTKSVKFTPTLPEDGNYQVYARWTSGSNRANNVPLNMVTAAGPQSFTMDETVSGQQWVQVGTGTFPFKAGTGGSVTITNTGTATGKYVTVDAVKFVRTGP